MIDTHAHISKEYYSNIKQVINDAVNNNVLKIIISACDKESISEGLELVKKYDNLYLSLGFHPLEANKTEETDLIYLENILKTSNSKIVALGEIGLDYHYDDTNKIKQRELFTKQLEMAVKYKLPVVIHSRDSVQETYDILKKYKLKGVIHCFSESLEMGKMFIRLGYYLGIGGVVTFKKAKIKDIVKELGLDNIVLETDSPYLSPIRGEVNAPKNIKLIAEFIANNNNLSLKEVELITNRNVKRVYNI
ncbi:MAG: TatD family hydrolase [Bacilli bacterium]